ncbi:MAG: SCO family protein [Paracoccaceae bacterium]
MPSKKTYAISAILLAAAGFGAGGLYTALKDDTFADCGGGVATGAASIGGPFTLVSETGATVTAAEVIDGPALIYFGYTFCPDVCPVDAAMMAETADMLAARGTPVKTVFISIDPERDTPEVLADFTDNLHPDMIGLTGPVEAVEAAKSAYKVYGAKAAGDDPEFYLMDHSAFIYLMAAPDRFLTIFRHGAAPQDMAETASCYLDALAAGA